jgi:colanic acid/amylovoran biosynthesis glycosyltransferase
MNPYSATFIRNQIHELAQLADVFPVHTGRFPEKREDGKFLNPLPYVAIQKLIKIISGNRNNYFSHYGFGDFLRSNQVDIVLVNYGPSAVYIMPLCRKLGIPMVVHFHGYDVTLRTVLKKYGGSYREVFDYASGIIAVSKEMKLHLENLGAPSEKIKVIPYGIDLTRFQPVEMGKETPVKFITVGRFTQKKAPLHTINAFAKVHAVYGESRLEMVGGKNELYSECVKLVKKLSIESAVTFSGVLPPQEVARSMQSAHVFLQHSIKASNDDMEGTPNSILEASACGLPVVSTLHGGIKEAVIHGVTGYLVPENDVDSMAEYMKLLLRNPEDRIRFGLAGRKHVELNYELKTQSKKLFNVLKEETEKGVSAADHDD